MKLHNVMEDIVKVTLKEFQYSLGLSCTCEKCLMDVMALTLNQLPPQYVVKDEGSAYIRAKYMDDQYQANVLCALANAAKIVESNKRHASE